MQHPAVSHPPSITPPTASPGALLRRTTVTKATSAIGGYQGNALIAANL